MIAIALIYGAISGTIVICSILLSFTMSDSLHLAGLEWLGYLVMVLALTLVFFGIKRYRDRDLGGVIRFLPALGMGLLITLIASLIYVLAWEVYLALTDHAFIAQYADSILAERVAEGVTGDALEAERAEMEQMKAQYANPLYRMPITFLEIFPVGLIVAIASAALLRNPNIAPARS